ncbi:MAG: hypothetical protein H7Y60_12370 [Rhodospirillaceae bacterium]|nr:hypothetical protein [Rhodospirillales bacterium]
MDLKSLHPELLAPAILAAMATSIRRSDGRPVLLDELRVARRAFLAEMCCQYNVSEDEIPANGLLYVMEWTGPRGKNHVSLEVTPASIGTVLGTLTYAELTGLTVVH